MLGLVGIHSFITDPLQSKFQSKKYLEHVLITQALSAWFWKKINGPIHLYTTEADAVFLRELKLLDIYDYVNTELLSREEGIPWDEFASVCKMRVVAAQQKFPFATIDNDLIFRTVLEGNDLNSDLTILHREVFVNRYYPPLEYLGKREDYEFPEFTKMKEDPINAGFLIWTTPQLARDYWAYASDYMKNNRAESKNFDWAAQDLSKTWKSLFVEQRLLANLVERDNYQVQSLFSLKYSSDIEVWVDKKGEKKDFAEAQSSAKIDFYHLWREKTDFYNFDPPICSAHQIRTFYKLIMAANELKDPLLDEIIDEILIFTIEKTFAIGLEDFYNLRTINRFLLK